jgi:predicted GIY-YIG superfamily endonuclease
MKHKKGDVKSTSGYANMELIWYAAFEDKDRALEFEKYLKSGSGKSFRNKHLIELLKKNSV